MSISIHDFREEFGEDLKKIWLEFIQDEDGSDLNIVPCQENAEKWFSFVKNTIKEGKGNLKVAIVEGEIAGYVFYRWSGAPLKTFKKRGEIIDLYVKPSFRGKGIGTLLLKKALEELKERGIEVVQLSVISKNRAAIKLYEKFRFVEVLKIMRTSIKKD